MAKSTDDAQKKINNIVVVGGGIQGTSVAYQLAKAAVAAAAADGDGDGTKITILEAKAVASAACGKGGGFMARSWGDGSPTQGLHELAFDMYEELAAELKCESYRKLPVLSVSPGRKGGNQPFQSDDPLVPNWLLGGNLARFSPMGYGEDTAQITPKEFVEQMLQHAPEIQVVLGKCTGVETSGEEGDEQIVTGVKYIHGSDEEKTLPADVVVVSAGPWSCQAEDWFPNAGLELPMEGIKSTSIVWNKPGDRNVDATALFCCENSNFGTHCKYWNDVDGIEPV